MVANAVGAGFGALSSLFGLLGSNANQMLSYKSNKKLQENQAKINYKYAEKSAKNSPAWNRAGLESAGYNPMLAVQNATSGANSSWTSGAHADTPVGPDYISSGISNAIDNLRLQNETSQVESVNDLNYANADKAKAEKATYIERLPYVSKQAKADYMKTEMESAKLENDIHYQNEYLNYLENSLDVQRKLGEMGVSAQYYSADKSYNASVYASDINERNNRRDNRLRRNTPQLPFGIKFPRGYFQPKFSEPFYDR